MEVWQTIIMVAHSSYKTFFAVGFLLACGQLGDEDIERFGSGSGSGRPTDSSYSGENSQPVVPQGAEAGKVRRGHSPGDS